MQNSDYISILKKIIRDSREMNKDSRLGQYLYNVIRYSESFPKTETAEDEEYHVGRILWYIEDNDLVKLIENFEAKMAVDK